MSQAPAAAEGAEYEEDDAGNKRCSKIGQHLYKDLTDKECGVMDTVREVSEPFCMRRTA